jgi:hypothetical protein
VAHHPFGCGYGLTENAADREWFRWNRIAGGDYGKSRTAWELSIRLLSAAR